MNNQTNGMCRICGNKANKLIYQQRYIIPIEFPLEGVQNIVSCEKCGFTYADSPNVNEYNYNDYYSLLSKYENVDDYYQELNEEICKQKNNVLEFVQKLQLSRNSFILEIGCANGHLLKLLKAKGYLNLLGVDPSPICVSNVKRMGIDAMQGYITSEFARDGTIDLLILDGVFEHIYSLDKALEQIYKKLKPSGKVLMTVPNAGAFAKHYSSPFYYFNLEHINYFSIYDFYNISNLFGFEVLAYNKFLFNYSSKLKCEALQVVLSKTDVFRNNVSHQYITKKNIKKHIEDSDQELDKIKACIKNIDKKEPVVIWGAGMHTYKMLGSTDLSLLNICAYIDNDIKKIGLHINGIEVRSSDYLNEFKGKIILSTSFSNKVIEKNLKNSGIKNTIISLDHSQN